MADMKQMESQDHEQTPQGDEQERSLPALTITIQSWATPVVGVVMLIAGLLGGYFGRPLLVPDQNTAAVSDVDVEEAPDIEVPSEGDQAQQRAAVMDTLKGDTRHFLGDEDAPVTIIEFSDFQCPYCTKWSNETGAEIKQQYIDKGQVRLGYWHFPFLGAQSLYAAEASECAGEQGAFWEYHDYLYRPNTGEGENSFNKENLKRFASELGLDTAAFNECLDSGRFTQFVQGQRSVAQQIGVSSTPTFLINGQPVIGAQPFPAFQSVIEEELSAATE